VDKQKITDFTDLIVWQKAKMMFLNVVGDMRTISGGKASFVIMQQVIRSAGSISANIAEGFGRKGQREFAYFLGISKGSACETQDWYYKLEGLSFLPPELVHQRIIAAREIIWMLNKLISCASKRSELLLVSLSFSVTP
jgi:four helix bundle protein